nr:PAS domain-containing sensor histidine kinase [Pleurocapsa sp. PCC 7319]
MLDDQINQEKREEQLIEFQFLLKNINAMILIFQDNQIYYVNPMTKVLTGYSKEELAVKTDLLRQLELQQKLQNSEFVNYIDSQHQQVKLLTKNGKQCWLDCSIKKIQFAEKPAIFLTAVDVTKYKQAANKSAQILEQNKKLISMVSHELRTPLNIISFSSRLLSRYSDRWKPSKVKKYLDRLQRGIDTLNMLIDDWLILGKAESENLKFDPQPLNLERFCHNLLSDLESGDRHIQQINFVLQGDCSSINVDRRILQLILTNLLENAIKYSPDGREIYFVVSCSFKHTTFSIKDQGYGIPQSDLDQLFEPFYRGKNVEQLPGNGLGLAVVKKLVDVLGGQIAIESEIGVGTEFVLSLPNETKQVCN